MLDKAQFSGLLVFVVGGSGVGKDSLLIGAQRALEGDEDFVFPKRLITRQSVAELEDHDTISYDEYSRMIVEGEAALNWEAHGLCYIVPKSIETSLRAGKIVVCNVSRAVIAVAAQKYPVRIANITAKLELRAQRLASRGREDAASIEERLARKTITLPQNVPVTEITNNGSLEEGIERFVDALKQFAQSVQSA